MFLGGQSTFLPIMASSLHRRNCKEFGARILCFGNLSRWVTLSKSSTFTFSVCKNAIILSSLRCMKMKGNHCRAQRRLRGSKALLAWSLTHSRSSGNARNSKSGFILLKICKGPNGQLLEDQLNKHGAFTRGKEQKANFASFSVSM